MAQLTLRTLLAYIDDTLEPAMARQLGAKVAESEVAKDLIEKIKKVTRRRGLKAPSASADDDGVSDPNTVAEYLSNSLDSEQVTRLEETCLQSDAHLAEVAACHQILTLLLTEPVQVPPQARQRMYKLVPAPASTPHRRPRKAQPVGGVVPEPPERETDDADTTFLLGLGRYSGASVMKRAAAVAAIVVLCGCLAFAVIMALPGHPPEPPEADRHSYTSNQTPAPPPPVIPSSPKDPDPKPLVPPVKQKDMTEPKVEPPPIPKKGNEDLVKRVAPPRAERVAIGKVESVNVIVLTRAEDGPSWLRLDPADEAGVTSSDPVLCLPGFKADVNLDSGVKVHLWGNAPDPFGRLLESRVRFHVPERKLDDKGEDFDADITLLAGRIYLKSTKVTGSRVRVRFAGQVWDVTLPDAKAEVVIEVITSFDPGTPFLREGGALPRVEVRAAVLGGTAGIAMPERFKSFPKIAAANGLAWDSKTGALLEPKPIEMGNAYFERFPLLASEHGKAVQKALSEMAGRLKDRTGIKLMLAEILTEPADPSRSAAAMLSIHAQAAIAFGPAAGDELKPLVDLLNDEMKSYARLATVNALAAWIAQAPGNTALLGDVLTAKLRNEQDPEIILRLLRGYASPAKLDSKDLDRLMDLLNHGSVAVRELALWNLVTIVDPNAPKTPGMVTDVALAGTLVYEKFLKAWKAHIEEIKEKMMGKK